MKYIPGFKFKAGQPNIPQERKSGSLLEQAQKRITTKVNDSNFFTGHTYTIFSINKNTERKLEYTFRDEQKRTFTLVFDTIKDAEDKIDNLCAVDK